MHYRHQCYHFHIHPLYLHHSLQSPCQSYCHITGAYMLVNFSTFELTGIQGLRGHKSHIRRPLPNPVATTEPWLNSASPCSHQNLCALSLTQRTQKPPCWSLANRCSHHSTLVVLSLPIQPSHQRMCPKPITVATKPSLLSSSDPCSHHSILVVLSLPLNPSVRSSQRPIVRPVTFQRPVKIFLGLLPLKIGNSEKMCFYLLNVLFRHFDEIRSKY